MPVSPEVWPFLAWRAPSRDPPVSSRDGWLRKPMCADCCRGSVGRRGLLRAKCHHGGGCPAITPCFALPILCLVLFLDNQGGHV